MDDGKLTDAAREKLRLTVERIERLEEQLEGEKEGRYELKDRLNRAEQNARDADRRREGLSEARERQVRPNA